MAGGGREPAGAAAHTAGACAQCGRSADPSWLGWGCYRIDEPDVDDEPQLAFFCPECAAREFGRPSRFRPASGRSPAPDEPRSASAA